jgi:DNA-binding NarL/FixJ family response regulator
MYPPTPTHPQRSGKHRLRLVLADDHTLVREGLRRLIDDQDDIEVVGEAKNGTEAMRLVAELRPSILLVDLSMPDLTGVEVTWAVRASSPGTQVIAVTRDRNPQSVAAMFAAGAAGYVLKQSASADLLRAIRTVATGTNFIDATLPQPDARQAQAVDDNGTQSQGTPPALDDLEQAVLDLYASALSDHDLAKRLSLDTKDVHAARVSGMQKAGLRTRVQVVAYVRARNRSELDEQVRNRVERTCVHRDATYTDCDWISRPSVALVIADCVSARGVEQMDPQAAASTNGA